MNILSLNLTLNHNKHMGITNIHISLNNAIVMLVGNDAEPLASWWEQSTISVLKTMLPHAGSTQQTTNRENPFTINIIMF